jgi:enamine deaminase RidA (YjgF/YER057c/UK114 family)
MSGRSKPEYSLLRPEVEKAYGYTHAVRVGDDIKISGAVSMDDQGNPTAVGDIEQQVKNACADLEKVLKHYGCTFDDVIVENVDTTNMAKFLEVAAYRANLYKTQFPTGTWVEVKGLALPEFLIEIELEAYAPTPQNDAAASSVRPRRSPRRPAQRDCRARVRRWSQSRSAPARPRP